MRGARGEMALALATVCAALFWTGSASALTRPRDGAVVSAPPLLRWAGVSGAKYYNVQLWRKDATGRHKVLSRWPSRHRLQLHERWHFHGRVHRFRPARYHWYVWPWLGTRYGRVRVNRGFVHGVAPANSSPPTISGKAREGAVLTARSGTWTGAPAPTVSFIWQRCAPGGTACVAIPGATSSTYQIAPNDIDLVLRAVAIGTNIVSAVAAPSEPSAIVLPAPPRIFSAPAVAGHPHVGATLTANRGVWSSARAIRYSYRWRRCAPDGGACKGITGATSRTYVAGSADEFKRLDVVVKATNSGGSSVAASPASARVGVVLEGTSGPDVLRGTRGSDWIALFGSKDVAYGGRGDDRIFAGRGRDRVYGGPGRDLIKLTDGARDRVSCGDGVDRVRADRIDRVSADCERVTRS